MKNLFYIQFECINYLLNIKEISSKFQYSIFLIFTLLIYRFIIVYLKCFYDI